MGGLDSVVSLSTWWLGDEDVIFDDAAVPDRCRGACVDIAASPRRCGKICNTAEPANAGRCSAVT